MNQPEGMSPAVLAERIRERAAELGFDDVGFCTTEPFDEWNALAWPGLRDTVHHDPSALMPRARTIVVAFRRYRRFGDWPQDAARIANYYDQSNSGYEQCKQLAEFIREHGFEAMANPELPAKRAALRTGLGLQGWNTQFSHDALGTLVSIHMVLTDALLPAASVPRTGCTGCALCEEACPTGAISGEVFDYKRCLRHHMIANRTVPEGLRQGMGMNLLGCTLCQHACPRAQEETVPVPEELLQACDLKGLLRGDAAQLDALARHIGTNYARPQRVMTQAALCAGNSGDRGYVPELSHLLETGTQPQRCHSAWSLGRLGGEDARAALQARALREEDALVLEEIHAALRGLA